MVFVLSEKRVRHLHFEEAIENIGIELNLIDYDAILFQLKIVNAPSLGCCSKAVAIDNLQTCLYTC
jgi:hypothetical protein